MESDRRSWWTRHWKWAAPSGCLVIVLLLFGGCVAQFSGVYGMVKDTGAYTQAIERVRSNPDAVAVLGTPVTTGWMLEGRVDDRGATGTADYSVPVSGPRGSGTLHIEARKSGGRWTFRELRLVPDDGPPIDLRTPEERTGERDETGEDDAVEA